MFQAAASRLTNFYNTHALYCLQPRIVLFTHRCHEQCRHNELDLECVLHVSDGAGRGDVSGKEGGRHAHDDASSTASERTRAMHCHYQPALHVRATGTLYKLSQLHLTAPSHAQFSVASTSHKREQDDGVDYVPCRPDASVRQVTHKHTRPHTRANTQDSSPCTISSCSLHSHLMSRGNVMPMKS